MNVKEFKVLDRQRSMAFSSDENKGIIKYTILVGGEDFVLTVEFDCLKKWLLKSCTRMSHTAEAHFKEILGANWNHQIRQFTAELIKQEGLVEDAEHVAEVIEETRTYIVNS